jgi:putative hydrolase of the HAD superfamily
VIEGLDRLKGSLKFGLLTNGAPDLQNTKIDDSGLREYFEVVVISGES